MINIKLFNVLEVMRLIEDGEEYKADGGSIKREGNELQIFVNDQLKFRLFLDTKYEKVIPPINFSEYMSKHFNETVVVKYEDNSIVIDHRFDELDEFLDYLQDSFYSDEISNILLNAKFYVQ